MGGRSVQSIQSKRTMKKENSVYVAANQQYLNRDICDLEEGMVGAAHVVTEKALDDIDQGIDLSKIYKDTDEMYRDLGV